MRTASPEIQAMRRVKRKSAWACAVFCLVALVIYCLVDGDITWRHLALQCGCGACFFGLGVAVGEGWLSPRTFRLGAIFTGTLTSCLFVSLSGGPASPYFLVFGALPCLVAMFTPDDWRPTLLCGAMTLSAVALLNAQGGVPVRQTWMQQSGLVLFMGLSLFGTRTYRREGEARREAQQQRLQALEQLAESERLRLSAERERAQVERLVLVGQLAAGVAHEVNNPLAYVKSNLTYLEQETLGSEPTLDREELRQVLSETRQGVQRIQQIITDLKGFSRADNAAEQGGQLREALEEARRLASVRLSGRGEVRLEFAPQLPAVRMGQRHLVQVVLNLLINAADAVEEAQPSRPPRICVHARRHADGVRLEVEDNGPGIAPDVLARLFEPFFTTKAPGKGTGLGLALCREYVMRCGGSLHAENRAQGGARFVVVLPGAPASLCALGSAGLTSAA